MKKVCFLICILSFFAVCGCAQKKERLALIDSFNETVTLYGEAARCMMLSQNTIDDDTMQILRRLGEKLQAVRSEIATDSMTKARMKEIIQWLSDCKSWSKEAICVWSEESSE